ncbi:biotin-dependent carboxyltransferase family protein [soil metagenome]
MAVEVQQPGLSTTVQDLGRPGHYHVGIPPSGALDLMSALAANLLVGNDDDAAVLECTFMGPSLRFDEPAVVAVTGGVLRPQVDGDDRPVWESFAVEAGDVLDFATLEAGARTYVGISGGIATAPKLGSRSTYALGSLGGFEGRPLQEGDVLPVGEGSGTAGRAIPEELWPQFPDEAEIRVVMGLYDHRLTDAGRETFLGSTYELTPTSDRVGFRYKGDALDLVDREQPFGAGSDLSNIVDAPYPIGSIQVPGGTEPIVLHRDAVSGGGYMMIGTVIGPDLDRIAQCQPSTPTTFVEVSLDEALSIRADRRAWEQRLRDAAA